MKICEENKKIWGHIVSSLRRIWLYYSTERKKSVENCKLGRGQYQCERCQKVFKQKEIQIHHIYPVGSIKDGVDQYLARLFCPVAHLKAVCKECHKLEHEDLKKAAQ